MIFFEEKIVSFIEQPIQKTFHFEKKLEVKIQFQNTAAFQFNV
jgi:hypothetical protein